MVRKSTRRIDVEHNQNNFLAAFAEVGIVSKAAEAAGLSSKAGMHYKWLASKGPFYDEYRRRFAEAKVKAGESLEAEARRRAVNGVKRFKFYKGQPIIDPETGKPYYELEYSDHLLNVLLNANLPDKFRWQRGGTEGFDSARQTDEEVRSARTKRWTFLRPHLIQDAVKATQKRFVALPCGRRSGKTELAKRRLVECLPIPIVGCARPRYAFCGPTNDQAKEIAWQDLLDLIPDCWIDGGKGGPNVSYSLLKIETIFGSSLRVAGLDRPERIEGKYLNGIVLDESSDLKPKLFDRVILPMLADHHGWAWRIGVPKRQGVGASEFRKFCEDCASGDYPDGACFAWPSADILPPEEIKHARETLDPKDFREQYEATWETAGGGIFHAFDSQFNVRPCAYRPELPIIVGCDFNVDPMAWVIGHNIEGKRLEWFDELWLRNTNTQAAINTLAGRYGDHKGGWQFYGDASGQARKSSASQTDYALILNDPRFKTMGRTVHFPAANPPVQDRFAACNAMFLNAAGERRMFVDLRCKWLIQDLQNRSYKPGTREVGDSGDVGHITDAMGYPVHRLFPIRVGTPGMAAVITGGR